MVSVAISSLSPAFAMDGLDDKEPAGISAYKGLNWQNRPDDIKAKIDSAFLNVSSHSSLYNWTYNGSNTYSLASVSETKLAHHLMVSNPEQKEFNFLDLGAGEFQFGDYLAQQINKFTDIPDDVKANIIGVRAEEYEGEECSTIGKCTIFKLGKFKLENMEEEEEKFKKKYFPLTNNIDVTVTSWCFRHL